MQHKNLQNESDKKYKINKSSKNKTIKKKKPFLLRFLFLILFILLLPLYLISIIFKLIVRIVKYSIWKREHKAGEQLLLSIGMTHIDLMQGYEFEYFLKTLFFYLGYDAKETPRRGDFGADLILTKDGIVTVVQAKRYSKNVGVRSVQEITLAKTHYQADRGMVVTNSLFTPQAEQLARENSIQLIDRHELQEMMEEVRNYFTDRGEVRSPYIDFEDNNRFRI